MHNRPLLNARYARSALTNSTDYAYIQQFGGGAAAAAALAYSSQSPLLYIPSFLYKMVLMFRESIKTQLNGMSSLQAFKLQAMYDDKQQFML